MVFIFAGNKETRQRLKPIPPKIFYLGKLTSMILDNKVHTQIQAHLKRALGAFDPIQHNIVSQTLLV